MCHNVVCLCVQKFTIIYYISSPVTVLVHASLVMKIMGGAQKTVYHKSTQIVWKVPIDRKMDSAPSLDRYTQFIYNEDTCIYPFTSFAIVVNKLLYCRSVGHLMNMSALIAALEHVHARLM